MKKLYLTLIVCSLLCIVVFLPSCKKDPPIPAQKPYSDTTGSWRKGKIFTVAGNGTQGYYGDGKHATEAEFDILNGVAVDASGNIYITDGLNERIRKVNSSTGIITTFGGTGAVGFSGDGGPVTNAELNSPTAITIDDSGNVYFSDEGNKRIRKINSIGIITTIAGNGFLGYSGDGGPATNAEMSPIINQLVFDTKGNLYIGGRGAKVRVISASGIITTFAGNGTLGYSGDGGPATDAELYAPMGVAVDNAGNVFIADFNNGVIREVNTSGIITTFAGNGTQGYVGDNGPATAAELHDPASLAFDDLGNLYIADSYNARIRFINTQGIISTYAGNGVTGYAGDGGLATDAELGVVFGITIDQDGNLYFGDNERLREVYKP